MTKVCRHCQAEKPIDDFPRQTKTRDHLSSWCKACHSQASREWIRNNPERWAAIAARTAERRWGTPAERQARAEAKHVRAQARRLARHLAITRNRLTAGHRTSKRSSRQPRVAPHLKKNAWQRARVIVFERDGEACQSCGRTAPWRLVVDHKLPVERGGDPYDPSNLWVLCSGCNFSKGSKTPEEWVQRPT